MSDHRIKNDLKNAQAILDAYADLEGLTEEECLNAGLSEKQCGVVLPALGNGTEGIITSEERQQMEAAGLGPSFVSKLESEAPHRRTRWLADNAVTRWYRSDYGIEERRWMIAELAMTGLQREEAMLAFAEFAKNWENENVVMPILRQHAASAVEGAIKLLKHPDKERRLQSIHVLHKISDTPSRDTASQAIPALVKAVGDPDEEVRCEVIDILGFVYDDKSHSYFGEILSALKPLLDVGRNAREIRLVAIETLGRIGRYDKTVRDRTIPVLSASAVNREEETSLRASAINELRLMSSSHFELLISLFRSLLNDPTIGGLADDVLRKVFDDVLKARAFATDGLTEKTGPFFEKAFFTALESEDIYHESGSVGRVLGDIASAVGEAKLPEVETIAILGRFVATAETIEDDRNRSLALSGIAWALTNIGRQEDAIRVFNAAVTAGKKIDNAKSRADVFDKITFDLFGCPPRDENFADLRATAVKAKKQAEKEAKGEEGFRLPILRIRLW